MAYAYNHIFGNYFDSRVYVLSNCTIAYNIISTSSNYGLQENGSRYIIVQNNSFLNTGSASYGIIMSITNNFMSRCIINNVIEGFTTGGIIWRGSSETIQGIYANNSFYNCGTSEVNKTDVKFVTDEGNETLGESPFNKNGVNNYANRFTYFHPKNIETVARGGWPDNTMFRGAVPYAPQQTAHIGIGF